MEDKDSKQEQPAKKFDKEEPHPFENLRKMQVLQETSRFYDSKLDERECVYIITKLFYIFGQGVVLREDESTALFVKCTLLFSQFDVKLRRMLYLILKELAPSATQTFIACSSLRSDLTKTGTQSGGGHALEQLGLRGSKESQVVNFKSNLLRTLRAISDETTFLSLERHFLECLVDPDSNVCSSAIISGLFFPKVLKRWYPQVANQLKSRFSMTQYHGLALSYKLQEHDDQLIKKLILSSHGFFRSPLSHSQLIKYSFRLLKKEIVENPLGPSLEQNELFKFLKSCLKYKNEIIVLELNKILINLLPYYITRESDDEKIKKFIEEIIISVRNNLLNSSPYDCKYSNISKYCGLKLLNQIPLEYSNLIFLKCSLKLEDLSNHKNKMLSTLSIIILLKSFFLNQDDGAKNNVASNGSSNGAAAENTKQRGKKVVRKKSAKKKKLELFKKIEEFIEENTLEEFHKILIIKNLKNLILKKKELSSFIEKKKLDDGGTKMMRDESSDPATALFTSDERVRFLEEYNFHNLILNFLNKIFIKFEIGFQIKKEIIEILSLLFLNSFEYLKSQYHRNDSEEDEEESEEEECEGEESEGEFEKEKHRMEKMSVFFTSLERFLLYYEKKNQVHFQQNQKSKGGGGGSTMMNNSNNSNNLLLISSFFPKKVLKTLTRFTPDDLESFQKYGFSFPERPQLEIESYLRWKNVYLKILLEKKMFNDIILLFCEFIEDCQYSMLLKKIIYNLGERASKLNKMNKIFNFRSTQQSTTKNLFISALGTATVSSSGTATAAGGTSATQQTSSTKKSLSVMVDDLNANVNSGIVLPTSSKLSSTNTLNLKTNYCIRFLYNRLFLENSNIRNTTINSLIKFGISPENQGLTRTIIKIFHQVLKKERNNVVRESLNYGLFQLNKIVNDDDDVEESEGEGEQEKKEKRPRPVIILKGLKGINLEFLEKECFNYLKKEKKFKDGVRFDLKYLQEKQVAYEKQKLEEEEEKGGVGRASSQQLGDLGRPIGQLLKKKREEENNFMNKILKKLQIFKPLKKPPVKYLVPQKGEGSLTNKDDDFEIKTKKYFFFMNDQTKRPVHINADPQKKIDDDDDTSGPDHTNVSGYMFILVKLRANLTDVIIKDLQFNLLNENKLSSNLKKLFFLKLKKKIAPQSTKENLMLLGFKIIHHGPYVATMNSLESKDLKMKLSLYFKEKTIEEDEEEQDNLPPEEEEQEGEEEEDDDSDDDEYDENEFECEDLELHFLDYFHNSDDSKFKQKWNLYGKSSSGNVLETNKKVMIHQKFKMFQILKRMKKNLAPLLEINHLEKKKKKEDDDDDGDDEDLIETGNKIFYYNFQDCLGFHYVMAIKIAKEKLNEKGKILIKLRSNSTNSLIKEKLLNRVFG